MFVTDSGGIYCTFAAQLPSPFPGILFLTDRQPSVTVQSPSMNQQCHDYMLHFIFTSLVLCVGVKFKVEIYRPIYGLTICLPIRIVNYAVGRGNLKLAK